MAHVKMCDSCGRVYFRNRKFPMKNDGGAVSGIQTFNSAGRKGDQYDICDDCLTKLFEWLNATADYANINTSKDIDPID